VIFTETMTKQPQPEEIRFKGKYLQMCIRDNWEFVVRPGTTGVVGIIAVTSEQELLLVEQYRPPVEASVIELPAGLSGDIAGQEDESFERAASRELLEETGYTAESWSYLGSGATSGGLTNEQTHLFLARNLTRVGPGGGDDSEEIIVHHIPLAEVQDWIQHRIHHDHVVVDFRVYAALFFIMKAGIEVFPRVQRES
jgi:ADP-ribose pyrophosphatase